MVVVGGGTELFKSWQPGSRACHNRKGSGQDASLKDTVPLHSRDLFPLTRLHLPQFHHLLIAYSDFESVSGLTHVSALMIRSSLETPSQTYSEECLTVLLGICNPIKLTTKISHQGRRLAQVVEHCIASVRLWVLSPVLQKKKKQ
jgi:hypothetical protein